MRKKILFIGLILLSLNGYTQDIRMGYSLGVAFSFGAVTNRLGFHSAIFLKYGFAQINCTANGYYNFQSLGKKKKALELQLGGGLQLGFGRKDTVYNNFIGLTENNTFHAYTFGGSYVRYWDKQGTSQSTGVINVNVFDFNFVTENDLFGNLVNQKDRFRTGAFLVSYQYNNTKVGINALLWTYDYSGCTIVSNENTKWARFGYYADANDSERNSSLGLLSIQVEQWLPYNQQARLNLGVNSEKFRNAFQNEFIHDQPFFPPKWVKRMPAHIPMFTIDGKQYLFLDGQKVKPAKFYVDLGLNPLLFY